MNTLEIRNRKLECIWALRSDTGKLDPQINIVGMVRAVLVGNYANE